MQQRDPAACIGSADLSSAKGVNKNLCTPLIILNDQPGKIRAYKLVTDKYVGPYNGGIEYKIGESYSVEDSNTDDTIDCGAGINLATLDWCMRNWNAGYHILIAEFVAKDIACIPIATDGKFRVHRCKIVGEKDLNEIWGCDTPNTGLNQQLLTEYGLPQSARRRDTPS